MQDRDFTSYTRDIIQGQERVLKTIFIKIFLDIYDSLKKCCHIDPEDKNNLDDLLYFNQDMDLIAATALYRRNYFKHKKLSDFYKYKFAIKNINGIINTTRINERMAKKNIIESIEIQKPYNFSLIAMEEVGRIAEEITLMRHMVAHNNNIQQSSQALILLGNISRLLTITPDSIRETTTGFNELENFVKINYFNSIVSIYRPDLEENRNIEKTLDKDIQDAFLMEKIDSLSDKLSELNEIKLAISKNQETVDDIKVSLKSSFEKDPSQLGDLSENIQDEVLRPKEIIREAKKDQSNTPKPMNALMGFITKKKEKEPKKISAEEVSSDPISKSEVAASNIEQGTTSDGLDDSASNEFNYTKIPMNVKTTLSFKDLEDYYTSYKDALRDEIQPILVANWAQKDMNNGIGLTRGDLEIVESFVKSGALDEKILNDYLEKETKPQTLPYLSDREMYDLLMREREKVKIDMSRRYNNFENWHNIFMTSLSREIIDKKIVTESEFRANELFQKYYNSQQIKGRLLESSDIELQKNYAKEYIDKQIEEVWPNLEPTLNHYKELHSTS